MSLTLPFQLVVTITHLGAIPGQDRPHRVFGVDGLAREDARFEVRVRGREHVGGAHGHPAR